MLVYHGSNIEVINPKIIKAIRFLDFGDGFYTTSNLEQAKSWALRVGVRNNSSKSFINVYEFDFEKAKRDLKFKEFEMVAGEEWLQFIVKCRNGYNPKEDIISGPIADDNVYSTIRNFETKVYDLEYAIKHLKTQKLKDQILFHTNKSLEYIKFIKSIEVMINE